jgi:hypothetical protein
VPQRIEIKAGVHFRRVESDMSREDTRRILRVLERPEILRALQQMPIRQILICRLPEQGTSGVYSYDDRTVTLNSARKMGVHFGETFRPGSTGNMSAATTNKLESLRRSLLHELAHHFEWMGEAGKLISDAFSNPGKRPITRYAATPNWREYFAESLVAYFVEPEALLKHDPTGSMMVKAVLAAIQKI